MRQALDDTIVQARADGRLAHWAAEEGVSWAPPGTTEIGRGSSPADLAAD